MKWVGGIMWGRDFIYARSFLFSPSNWGSTCFKCSQPHVFNLQGNPRHWQREENRQCNIIYVCVCYYVYSRHPALWSKTSPATKLRKVAMGTFPSAHMRSFLQAARQYFNCSSVLVCETGAWVHECLS